MEVEDLNQPECPIPRTRSRQHVRFKSYIKQPPLGLGVLEGNSAAKARKEVEVAKEAREIEWVGSSCDWNTAVAAVGDLARLNRGSESWF
jgi:hypothetical protein